MKEQKYQKFDVICAQNLLMGVIVSDLLEVPYFNSGIASKFCTEPLDIQNPAEWTQSFSAYIVFDLVSQSYDIVATHNIKSKYDVDDPDSIMDSYIPYDIATDRLRVILGLLSFSDRLEKKSDGNSQRRLGLMNESKLKK